MWALVINVFQAAHATVLIQDYKRGLIQNFVGNCCCNYAEALGKVVGINQEKISILATVKANSQRNLENLVNDLFTSGTKVFVDIIVLVGVHLGELILVDLVGDEKLRVPASLVGVQRFAKKMAVKDSVREQRIPIVIYGYFVTSDDINVLLADISHLIIEGNLIERVSAVVNGAEIRGIIQVHYQARHAIVRKIEKISHAAVLVDSVS